MSTALVKRVRAVLEALESKIKKDYAKKCFFRLSPFLVLKIMESVDTSFFIKELNSFTKILFSPL